LSKETAAFQWAQLLVLTGVHFSIDMFAGLLPPILPVVQAKFALTLITASFILAVLNLTCNGVQVLTGHMRAEQNRPFFLHIGLMLAACMCLLAILPKSGGTVPAMLTLAIISGCGIAVAHPEGLRAVHSLSGLPSALSTSVYMAGGFTGYATGGWLSAVLVSAFGLRGLYPLILCSLTGIVMILLLRIHLAVEPKQDDVNNAEPSQNQVPFGPIMLMAIPVTISTTIIVWLLPIVLNGLGFELVFGGFSTMMFGMASAVGAFFWAAIAHKKGELFCSVVSLFVGIPLLAIYLVLISNRMAVWILFGAGFCSAAAYPLIVTLARRARGPNLGRRMGLVVGGAWGLASVVYIVLMFVAKHFGFDVQILLRLTPAGYLLAGIIGLFIIHTTAHHAGTRLPTTK